jgi:hypothetical protein
MNAPKLIVGDENRTARTTTVSATERASKTWGVLWWMGGFLFLAGLIDQGLALYPSAFGDPAWRFSAFASMANGLPLLMVGLLAATMASMAGNRPGRAKFAMVLNAIATIGLAGLLIGFLASAKSLVGVAAPEAQVGLYKGIFKTVTSAIVFGLAAAAAWRGVAGWLRSLGD